MKNLKVGKKLLLSFAVVLALFLLSLAVAIVGILQNAQALDDFYEQPFNVVDTTWSMREATMSIERDIFWIVTSNDQETVQQCKAEIESNVAVVDNGITALKESFLGDPQLLNEYISITDQTISAQDKIVDLALQLTDEGNAQALVLMDDYLADMDKANEKLVAISDFAHNNAVKYNDNGTRIKVVSVTLLAVLGAVSLGISIFLCLYVTRGITKPLSEVEHAVKELSQGRLDAKIEYRSRDELGSLANAMRDTVGSMSTIIGDVSYLLGEMSRGNFVVSSNAADSYLGEFSKILDAIREINSSLIDTLGQITQSADQVDSGSDQVSSGAQALSQGATEQASSIEELSATITEISTQIKENAENADAASREADEAGRMIGGSNQQMQELSRAMADIRDSSSEIGKIIKTIEDIAFQTNILALNAAVEAARAGEAGKGFAVVADEVRNLASKSSEASKSTASMIEASVSAVENGTSIADSTAQSMLEVVKVAKHVAETVTKIAHASERQAQSVEQVTLGVEQISAVVQTNSATAEESAAASEELSGQAANLKQLVSRFRLQ